jgi:hypothetical protein
MHDGRARLDESDGWRDYVLLEGGTGMVEAQPQQKLFACNAVMGCSSDAC